MKQKTILQLTWAIISIIIATIITNLQGDQWEEPVRTVLYKLANDSVPDYAQEFVDEKGVPFVYYPEQNGITAGKQYNPTIVCNYAIKYYNQLLVKKDAALEQKFRNCVAWLSGEKQMVANGSLFVFNWQQPWYDSVGVPYTSGMTSGLAMEVFTYASKYFNDPHLLDTANSFLRGFYVPIDSGGFTYKFPYGWWYEELADTAMHSPFILDGHIFALLGVYQYNLYRQDDSATFIFNQGVKALKHYLPQYDIGNGAMYYDKYGKLADKKYQRILTRQMKQLADITGDKMFVHYYEKWNAPLAKPYVLRVLQERNISGIVLYGFIIIFTYTILLLIRQVSRRIGKSQL